MEQNQQLLEQIQQKFLLKQMPAKEYSPLVLAYIGDGIYDMIVRTIFVSYGNTQVDKLNKQASNVCRASSQAAIAFAIAPLLTEEETSAYRRGRNARSFTKAKNATMSDYRHATGLEALCGYLYLNGEMERFRPDRGRDRHHGPLQKPRHAQRGRDRRRRHQDRIRPAGVRQHGHVFGDDRL